MLPRSWSVSLTGQIPLACPPVSIDGHVYRRWKVWNLGALITRLTRFDSVTGYCLMRLAVLILSLMLGCATAPTEPKAIALSMNGDLVSPGLWQIEASTRFPKPFVFACHGRTKGGVWMCYPDGLPPTPVETVATILARLYPDRQIVLVCCNSGGTPIHVAHVYYARQMVWSTPDRFNFVPRDWYEPITGSIKDFSE